jgi:hypothetical protein
MFAILFSRKFQASEVRALFVLTGEDKILANVIAFSKRKTETVKQ